MAKRERSKAYPSIPIDEAVILIERIRNLLGIGPFTRGDIAESLGAASLSGPTGRKIAALVHYGLLDRSGADYTISDLATRVINPRDENERKLAIRDSVLAVDLFNELIERYRVEGKIPEHIENRLVRDHGISQSAKGNAAEVFRASTEFAGIISIDGAFIDENLENTDQLCEQEQFANKDIVPDTNTTVHTQGPVHMTNPEVNNKQHFRIALSEGKTMYMEVPTILSKIDIAIIRKHIELLELQAGQING